MDTRQQLEMAKTLIQSKRYHEARRLLVRINHPAADSWLRKLDQVAPLSDAPQSRASSLILGAVSILSLVVSVFILMGLGAVFVQMQNGQYRGNYTELLPWALAVLILLPLAYFTRKARRS